jgi:hypothetical protein
LTEDKKAKLGALCARSLDSSADQHSLTSARSINLCDVFSYATCIQLLTWHSTMLATWFDILTGAFLRLVHGQFAVLASGIILVAILAYNNFFR